MALDLHRLTFRSPVPVAVFVLSNQVLLLGVHADYRLVVRLMGFDLLVELVELIVAVGALGALQRFDVALQAETLLAQQVRDHIRTDLVARVVNSAARLRADRVVHRSGDIGSPRSSGSTNASNAGTKPGSLSDNRLRPPPGRRTRPSGACPDSNSVTPSDTVASRIPAVRATNRIPPCPHDLASAATANRR